MQGKQACHATHWPHICGIVRLAEGHGNRDQCRPMNYDWPCIFNWIPDPDILDQYLPDPE